MLQQKEADLSFPYDILNSAMTCDRHVIEELLINRRLLPIIVNIKMQLLTLVLLNQFAQCKTN